MGDRDDAGEARGGNKKKIARAIRTGRDAEGKTEREAECEVVMEERSEREERYKWKACSSPARWQLWQRSACSDGGLAIWRVASRLSHRC